MSVVTGDYGELKAGKSVAATHPVSVRIDNVDKVDGNSFVELQPNNYAPFVEPFSATNSFWFNHHHCVFRAKGKTATVTIKDWLTDSDPSGPARQELMYNFAELQPYFEE